MNTIEELIKLCDNEKIVDRGLTFKETYEAYIPLTNGETFNTFQSIEGAKRYNLTKEDLFYILAYTGGTSRTINPFLIKKMSSHCIDKYCKGLDKALNKIDGYTNSLVFRNEINSFESDNLSTLKLFRNLENKVFSVNQYWSTSKSKFNPSAITFRIQTNKINSNARDISQITNNTSEQEVLFLRNSKFQIISVDIKLSEILISEKSQNIKEDISLSEIYFMA